MRDVRARAASDSPRAAQNLMLRFLHYVVPQCISGRSSTIAVYYAQGDEMDLGPLCVALWQAGFSLALPVVVDRNHPLVFRSYTSSTALVPDRCGVMAPDGSVPEVFPDYLCVPLLAVDEEGYRLGYGGGYYDRTIHALRQERSVQAWGVAYEAQCVPWVPHDALDMRLDGVVTDQSEKCFL